MQKRGKRPHSAIESNANDTAFRDVAEVVNITRNSINILRPLFLNTNIGLLKRLQSYKISRISSAH